MDLLLQEVIALGDIGHTLQKEIREFLSKHRQRASLDLDAELKFEQAGKGAATKNLDKKPDSGPSFIDWINAREHETHFPPTATDEGTASGRPAGMALPRTKR
jgi:hypothetical protein